MDSRQPGVGVISMYRHAYEVLDRNRDSNRSTRQHNHDQTGRSQDSSSVDRYAGFSVGLTHREASSASFSRPESICSIRVLISSSEKVNGRAWLTTTSRFCSTVFKCGHTLAR